MYLKADKNKIQREKLNVERNAKAMKILMYEIGPDKYNKITLCTTTKEILDAPQTNHEGSMNSSI